MSLAYYYSLLRLKEEQLQRLQLCNGELKSCQQDFTHHERLVSEPELSTNTWNGTLAHAFDDSESNRNVNKLSRHKYQSI